MGCNTLTKVTVVNFPPKKYPRPIYPSKLWSHVFCDGHVHKYQTQLCIFIKLKIFFVNNSSVSELQIFKFLTLQEAMVTQICVASSSPNFHKGERFKKKRKVSVLTFKLQVLVFQLQGFAFRAAISISYREITAERVTLISVHLE